MAKRPVIRFAEVIMALNLHKLFFNQEGDPHYLGALAVEPATDAALREARDQIRKTLRAGLRDWSKLLRQDELFDKSISDSAPTSLAPKFRMQGSFAYFTANEPEQQPPQEVDLDDGVFLPVSFLTLQGGRHPSVVSQGYFLAVERCLKDLCRRNRWSLITDKPSCVRVQITRSAHIDLALYAIADEQFRQLEEAAAKSLSAQQRQAVQDSPELSEALYRSLSADGIMLAHRDEGWKPSDPRKLEDWVKAGVERHGPQLRRVWRYLKGWRDFQWEESRLASVALMAAAVTIFDRNGPHLTDSRDDLAMRIVGEALPTVLAARIENPVVEGQRLDEGWGVEERSAYVQAAQRLCAEMTSAMAASDSETAIEVLQNAFGRRIPDDAGLVRDDSPIKPAILSAGLLRASASDPAARAAVEKRGSQRFG